MRERRPQRRRGSHASTVLVLGLTGAMLFAAWHHIRPHALFAERAEREVAAPALTRYAHNTTKSVQDSRCLAATASRVAAPPTIHRWKDADGVVHYSDKPPSTMGHREHTMHVSSDAAPIELDIISHGAVLPAHVTSRAIAHAVGVGKVMGDLLGLEPADGLAMQVVFAGTDAEFRAAAGPRAPSSTGVYISSKRRMVVRANREEGVTLRTLRHEIVHAMLHEWVGSALPPALEEGLAIASTSAVWRGRRHWHGRKHLARDPNVAPADWLDFVRKCIRSQFVSVDKSSEKDVWRGCLFAAEALYPKMPSISLRSGT